MSEINDRTPAFKIGDRVEGYAEAWGCKGGVIVRLDLTSRDQLYRIKDDDTGYEMWLVDHTVKAVAA